MFVQFLDLLHGMLAKAVVHEVVKDVLMVLRVAVDSYLLKEELHVQAVVFLVGFSKERLALAGKWFELEASEGCVSNVLVLKSFEFELLLLNCFKTVFNCFFLVCHFISHFINRFLLVENLSLQCLNLVLLQIMLLLVLQVDVNLILNSIHKCLQTFVLLLHASFHSVATFLALNFIVLTLCLMLLLKAPFHRCSASIIWALDQRLHAFILNVSF